MLLRICLIVAILAGAGTVAVNFLVVKPKMEQLVANRDSWKDKDDKEVAAHNQTKTKLKNTQNQLDSTKKTLAQTRTELSAANTQIDDQKNQIAQLNTDKKAAEDKRDEFQAELAKFDQLHVKPEDVVRLQADLKKSEVALAGVSAENKIINDKLADVTDKLRDVLGYNTNNPIEPSGLRGQIVAVDPKYEFVVLNVGHNKDVVNHGVMMVARDGKYIGKVRISRVDKTECVANVMPDWARGQVMEGDEVLPQ